METLPTLVFPPKTAHSHTVIFLHGRGDNAQNFSNSLNYSRDSNNRTLIEVFPSFRWVFPQAPIRKCISGPETFPQWFDVYDVRDFASREEIQLEGLREVVPEIIKILTQEANLLGGRWDKLVLAGISMGAATSLHTLFNLEIPRAVGGRLGAFLGFSARCPFAGRSLDEMRKVMNLETCVGNDDVLTRTPMLLEHCTDDPLVLVKNGEGLRNTLMGFGAQVTWIEYPDGGHWFNAPKGMDDAIRFLNTVLGIKEHIDGVDPEVDVDVEMT